MYPAYGPTVDLARAARHAHARRASVFGADADMFGDVAWLILLDLYIAQADGRTVRMGDTAGAAPGAVMIRWLRLLITRGLVQAGEGAALQNGSGLYLTPMGTDRIEAALHQ